MKACAECTRLVQKLQKLTEENEWLRRRNAAIVTEKDSENSPLGHPSDEPTELEIAICALSDRDQTIARLRQELEEHSREGNTSADGESGDEQDERSPSHGVRAFGFQSRAFEVADRG